ncbi:MAG TPA: hypothetical protein DEF04_05710 [Clostridiales bacterium]|nr:hypothetical protein [Clostridiales bacterium]
MFILLLSFILPRIIPGSPLSYAQYDTYILNQSLPEDTFNAFKDYYAPHEPLHKQFVIFIGHLLNFDLGYSFYYRISVIELIAGRLPWTLLLSFSSLIISSFIAISLGIKASLSGKHSKLRILIMTGIQSMPAFLVAVLIQGILSYKLKLLPAWGAYTPGIEFFIREFYTDVLKHSILPLTTLILCEIPGIYFLTYNSTQKIKKENYVTMAYYLNIDEAQVQNKFIFKNIVPEILGKLNVQFLYAITGSLFAEAVFS